MWGDHLKKEVILYMNLRHKLQNNTITENEYDMSINQLKDLLRIYIHNDDFNSNNDYNVNSIIKQLTAEHKKL